MGLKIMGMRGMFTFSMEVGQRKGNLQGYEVWCRVIEKTDSSWVVMSCLSSSIEAAMEDYMVVLMDRNIGTELQIFT
jgi:hypothetical protein